MKKQNKNNLIFVFLLVFFFFLFLGLKTMFKPNYDNFASCLTENNFVLFGSKSCPACNRQINMFGDSFKDIEFIDCNEYSFSCTEAGIRAFPTWRHNGELLDPGIMSLKELSQLSGCVLS